MKAIIATLFTMLTAICQAQFTPDSLPINKETGLVDFTAIVTADSMPAQKLYSNAKMFIATAFNSAKSVTDMTDDASFTIMAKGNLPVYNIRRGKPVDDYGWFGFSMTIRCKDNKYWYSITNYDHTSLKNYVGSYGPIEKEKVYGAYNIMVPMKFWNSLKEQAYTTTLKIIADLKKYMVSGTYETKDF